MSYLTNNFHLTLRALITHSGNNKKVDRCSGHLIREHTHAKMESMCFIQEQQEMLDCLIFSPSAGRSTTFLQGNYITKRKDTFKRDKNSRSTVCVTLYSLEQRIRMKVNSEQSHWTVKNGRPFGRYTSAILETANAVELIF